ncbi:MAG: bifunctional phosphoribosylaminoimidazolecarboxamide formyltransferase/IMP cyclohydrolase [Candidatus Daviesbacteria bacterium]|nr:bifunctional phosphoribosylaminoimidazolecarboxamide formyltransferase/IMP cyclohydrolase [Candidatus Daviesbacteria bacterium]
MNSKKIALISVYNKEGIVKFAKVLRSLNYEIISTGGTYKILIENGIKATPIEQITKNPRELFDGRIKTISFQIAGGILYDRKKSDHVKQAQRLGIPGIDIVICNLYPFEKKPNVENIDVGGPTMVRAAAKNYESVLVVIDPNDYEMIADVLARNSLGVKLRKHLAAKAFYHLSVYDSQIGKYFSDELFPPELTVPFRRVEILRYGENPHQKGAFYLSPNTNSPFAKLKHLWGRDLSGTNMGDVFAGLETVRMFKEPVACVIKHHSPCGVAIGKDSKQALERAIAADPVSAFGGVIVLNKMMDLKTAKIIATFKHEKMGNIDIVAVPKITKEALALLEKIRKSMGIYTFDNIPKKRNDVLDLRWYGGGALMQNFDDEVEKGFKGWKVVTEKKPTKKQIEQMKFGFKAVKAVRSNAVLVVDKNIPMTRGIGAGQTSRVGATKIALEQAGKYCQDGILVSDSFFPFDDCVKLAAKYKIGAILEQGGSINDQSSIDAANKAKIVMVFSGRRAFRH